jgi:hypothetical protein
MVTMGMMQHINFTVTDGARNDIWHSPVRTMTSLPQLVDSSEICHLKTYNLTFPKKIPSQIWRLHHTLTYVNQYKASPSVKEMIIKFLFK